MTVVKDFESGYVQVGKWSREIVAKRVGIIAGLPALLAVVVTLLTQLGIHVPDGLPAKVTNVTTAALTLLGLLVGVLWARTGTTTANIALNPVSASGQVLVEASTAAAVIAAATGPSVDELANLDKAAADVLASPDLPPAIATTDIPADGQAAS